MNTIPTNNPTTCKERYESKDSYTLTPKFKGEKNTVGEVCTVDDYETKGFKAYNNLTRSLENSNKWREETRSLAKKSLMFYGFEFVFKLLSYLFKQVNNEENKLSTRIFFGIERLLGTTAGMFRNMIYGRDDDNVGAEKEAEKQFGDRGTAKLSILNNFLQTKARFLVPIIGFFNPSLANDIDCGVITPIDSMWWRNMSLNTGFYPGIAQDTFMKFKSWITGNRQSSQNTNLPNWGYFIKHTKELWETAMRCKKVASWKTDDKNRFQLLYYRCMDRFTSVIMPFICLPSNIFGDTFRPIARRLGLEGLPRNITRVLSVADRSILGINYWFRFFKTEQLLEEQNNIPLTYRASNFYLASLVGDILDLPLTIFEDKVKESNKLIQHSVEILRMIKDSAFNAFWAARRIKK